MEDFDDDVQFYIDEGMDPEEARAHVMSHYFGGEPDEYIDGDSDGDEHY